MFIGATLESIIAQATDEVEIVVLDGGSTDNTSEVVRGFQARFPRLRYVQQPTKMGIDKDFARAVELAEGIYCWLFSDDDILKPGAIQTALKATQVGYSLIIANAEVRNADLSKILEPKKLPLNADRIYKPADTDSFLAACGRYMSFIGCVIIRSEVWRAREKEKYFGSYFVHVGVIFQSALPQDTLVIAEPLIAIRYGNAMWFSKYFEIWMFKWPGVIWSFVHIQDSAKSQVCPKEPWHNIGRLMIHRAKGAYTESAYVEWLEPRLASLWSRSLSKGVAYLPGRIANFLAFVFYAFFSRNSARSLVLLDMENSPFYWLKRPLR
jgi:glycosyltransferase involved in cell wall biosynthesis